MLAGKLAFVAGLHKTKRLFIVKNKDCRNSRLIFYFTGAGSGIGRATCKALAREGAKVVVADQNVKKSEGTAAVLNG